MILEIDQKILDKTTNCLKNFDCIKSDNPLLCKVEECLNKKVYFVKQKNHKYCPYKMSFGLSTICNCPTRKEIFNKYVI